MPTLSSPAGRFAVLSFTLVTLAFATARAVEEDSRSAAAAKQLTAALDRAKLDSIAVADPAEKDQFMAALYFPGAQLLVVSARYSVPTLLTEKLAKKDYRDVYIDLNAASVAGTKVFIMDQGADGLTSNPGDSQAPDSWEQGTTSTLFDGDWKKAKISEDEYTKAFAAADERYARMLTLLAEQAQKSGS
jgi:hypothetical protein